MNTFATITDTFVTVYRMGDNWTPVRLDRSPAGRGFDHHQVLAWMGYRRRVGGSISSNSRALTIDVEPIS